jgi:NitT/TauT family transport system substrate-binding protein
MMGRRTLTALLLVTVVIGLTSRGEAQRVNVAIPGFSQLVPFITSKDRNFYREEGLDVEFILMRAGIISQALTAGNVEFATFGGTTIANIVRGFPFRIVFTGYKAYISSLYVKPDIPDIKGLKGKRVGVSSFGTATDLLLRDVLKRNGLEGGRDVVVLTVGGTPTRYAALEKGAIDGAMLTPPFTFALGHLGFRELVNFAKEDLIETMANLVVREDMLRSNPTIIEKMTRATIKGFLYARVNRAGTIPVIARLENVDKDTAARIYDESFRPATTETGTLSEEDQSKALERYLKLLAVNDPPPVERVFDYRLAKKVSASLAASGWKP